MANLSLSEYLFRNYFGILAKAMTQNAMEVMERYPYRVQTGDSAAKITAKVSDLFTANQNVALKPGVGFVLPQVDYQVRAGDTLQSVAMRFGLDDEGLKQRASIQELPAPLSVLHIRDLPHTVAPEESLAKIAAQYQLSIESLAERCGDVQDLFVTGSTLIVPDVPVVSIKALKEKLIEQGMINNSGAMVSSVMLSGLRLPASATQTSFDQAPTLPLFTLSGQQFAANGVSSFKLKNKAKDSLIDFKAADGTISKDELTGTIEASDLSALRNLVLQPDPIKVGRLALYRYLPELVSLNRRYDWQVSSWPDLRCLYGPDGKIFSHAKTGGPDLWLFPDSFTERLPATETGSSFFELVRNDFSDPLRKNEMTDLDSYCFATALDLSLHLIIRPDGSASEDSYLMGAPQDGQFDLLKLLTEHLSTRPQKVSLYWLYTPKQPEGTQSTRSSTGYITEDTDPAGSFLLKTKPLSGVDDQSELFAADLTARGGFLQLLFDCAQAPFGAYYYRHKSPDGKGFPAHIFDDKGVAKLKLLAVLEEQNESYNRELLPFNNCAIVADNIDGDATQVILKALTHQVQPGESLQSILIRSEYADIRDVMTVEKLALANKNIAGVPCEGFRIISNGNEYRVLPGESFAALAARAGTSVEILARNYAAESELLSDGCTLQFQDGFLHRKAGVEPGHAGFEIICKKPSERGFSKGDQSFHELFQLLGYRVKKNEHFRASAEGLAMTPTEKDDV